MSERVLGQVGGERTLYEVSLNIHYSIRLHSRHCRLFERLRKITSFLTVLAGTAVIGALKTDSAPIAMIIGLVVTVLGTANLVWDFGGIARVHEGQRKKYNGLLSQLELTIADADRMRSTIANDDPVEIEALRLVALNDTYKSFGHDDLIIVEPFTSSFMRFLA